MRRTTRLRKAQETWDWMLRTLREIGGWDEDDVLAAVEVQKGAPFDVAIGTICMAIRAGMSSNEFCTIARYVREGMDAGQTGGVVTTDFGIYAWGDAA